MTEATRNQGNGEGLTRSVLLDEAQAQLGRLRSDLEVADRELRGFVERQPLVALLGAVAAGFFAGRLIRR